MTFSQERKHERMVRGPEDTISVRMFNLALGGCIFYGLLLNVFIVVLFGDFFSRINPILFFIGYCGLCYAGVQLLKSDSPERSFLGYNLIVLPMGALVSAALPDYAAADIRLAVILTAVVVALKIVMAMVYPDFFCGMGRTLFFSLLLGLTAELSALLLGLDPSVFNWAFVLLFTMYIGYDWNLAQTYPKTFNNAIDSALDIYLDIILLFVRILNLLSKDRK